MRSGIKLLLFLLLLVSCKGRRNETMLSVEENQALSDSSLIFDGKSLDGWEITNFGPQGPVYVSGGELVLGMGDGCTGVTYKKAFPVTDYKVTLEAKRVAGVDFFCGMTFPVGDEPCSLIVGGWGGTTVGLSSIDGLDASENETTRLMKFEKNRWYEICLEVRKGEIKAWIDDSLVVDFTKKGRKLSIRPEVELSKPFGICSWTTTAALRNIRLENAGLDD
ncbi:MAG TPA: DUF1080 domain-containing protein [Bacteroidales bacterium]|nr:DUF1080 domain-containing protein [Bacteroidales bacterium]